MAHARHAGHILSQAGNIEELVSEASDPCKDFEYVAFKGIVHNNLGNTGPDSGAEGIVYEGVHMKPGEPTKPILMVVNSTSPFKPADSGLSGKYAMIACEGNTAVSVTARFLDAVTYSPVTLAKLEITFLDLDTHQTGNEVEYIRVWDYANYLTTKNSLVEAKSDDTSATFTATVPGDTIDNPQDPFLLTSDQKNKAVTVEFVGVDHFHAEFGSKDKLNIVNERRNRAFLMAPLPSLLCARTQEPDTTGGISVPYVASSTAYPSTTTVTTTTTVATTTTAAWAPTTTAAWASTTSSRTVMSETTTNSTKKLTTTSGAKQSKVAIGWYWFVIPIITGISNNIS